MTLEEQLRALQEMNGVAAEDPSMVGFDPLKLYPSSSVEDFNQTGELLRLQDQPKTLMGGASKVGTILGNTSDKFWEGGIPSSLGYLSDTVIEPTIDAVGDFSTALSKGLVTNLAGMGGQLLGGQNYAQELQRESGQLVEEAKKGGEELLAQGQESVGDLYSAGFEGAKSTYANLQNPNIPIGDTFNNALTGARDFVSERTLPALSNLLYDDPNKLGTDGLPKVGMPKIEMPKVGGTPSPTTAPPVAAPKPPRSPEQIGNEAGAGLKTALESDNKKVDTDAHSFLSKLSGFFGEDLGMSAALDNWNGLSPSTKAALFGSAITLYAKSQGWKNTAAEAAKMTGNAWVGLQGKEMDNLSMEQRAAYKAAQDAAKEDKGTMTGVADMKYSQDLIASALERSEEYKDKLFSWGEQGRREDLYSDIGQRYRQAFPTKEAQAANPLTDSLVISLAKQVEGLRNKEDK